MLVFVRGLVSEKTDRGVIIDVNGLGYDLQTTNATQAALTLDQEAKLIVYEHIKADSHDLYGFLDQSARRLFETLLAVSGLGPKMALAIMNLGQAAAVRTAIANGDTGYLMAANKVGKRLAERIVVDLKDKVGLTSDQDATAFLQSDQSDEAVEALVALGVSTRDALISLKDVDTSLTTADRVKAALKGS